MRISSLLVPLALLAIVAGNAAAADSDSAGNAVFRVIVEDSPGVHGLGVFTVLTGPAHPAGQGHELLFAGASRDDAASSYLTVRSYTTGTDYVQTTSGAASGNLVSVLDSYGAVEPIGSAGYRTTYSLPGTGYTPDALRIVAEIEVTGTDPSDSVVLLHTTLTNQGPVPLLLGVRYLLDFANGGDDGPAWRDSGSPPQVIEGTRGASPDPMTLAPTAPNAAPVAITVAAPDAGAAAFASWKHAFPFAFDYTVVERDVAGSCGLNDSALLVYWGATPADAITLAPDETATVSLTLSPAGASGFPSDADTACATPPPTATPAPGEPALAPQPVELPRTGGLLLR